MQLKLNIDITGWWDTLTSEVVIKENAESWWKTCLMNMPWDTINNQMMSPTHKTWWLMKIIT